MIGRNRPAIRSKQLPFASSIPNLDRMPMRLRAPSCTETPTRFHRIKRHQHELTSSVRSRPFGSGASTWKNSNSLT
jgi:hypothetical protein